MPPVCVNCDSVPPFSPRTRYVFWRFNVPALTVTGPTSLVVGPTFRRSPGTLTVSVPAPLLVSPPPPLMLPERVRVLAAGMTVTTVLSFSVSGAEISWLPPPTTIEALPEETSTVSVFPAIVYWLELLKLIVPTVVVVPSTVTVRGAVIAPKKLAIASTALGEPPDQLAGADQFRVPVPSAVHCGSKPATSAAESAPS